MKLFSFIIIIHYGFTSVISIQYWVTICIHIILLVGTAFMFFDPLSNKHFLNTNHFYVFFCENNWKLPSVIQYVDTIPVGTLFFCLCSGILQTEKLIFRKNYLKVKNENFVWLCPCPYKILEICVLSDIK